MTDQQPTIVTEGPPAGPPAPPPKRTFKDRPFWQKAIIIILALWVGSAVVGAFTNRGGTAPPNSAAPAANTTPRPAAPEAPAAPAFSDISLSGTGSRVEQFTKPEGIAAIVEIEHSGSSNVAVWTVDASGNEGDLLVNEIGSYSGTTLIDVSGHTSALKVEADGRWTARIRPLSRARSWNGQSALSGNGDDVVVVTPATSGLVTLDLTHSGASNFAVFGYGESGGSLLVNEIGDYSGQVLVPNGTVVLEVTADGAWSGTPG